MSKFVAFTQEYLKSNLNEDAGVCLVYLPCTKEDMGCVILDLLSLYEDFLDYNFIVKPEEPDIKGFLDLLTHASGVFSTIYAESDADTMHKAIIGFMTLVCPDNHVLMTTEGSCVGTEDDSKHITYSYKVLH